MNWEIPLFKIYWDGEDIARVTDIIKSGSSWASGENVGEFERKID